MFDWESEELISEKSAMNVSGSSEKFSLLLHVQNKKEAKWFISFRSETKLVVRERERKICSLFAHINVYSSFTFYSFLFFAEKSMKDKQH